MLRVKTAISSTKKTKQQRRQILNLNTKTIENKHFIHYLKRFPQTLSVCFCKFQHLNTSISVFLFLSKVSVLVHFQESMRWLFLVQTFISLVIHFPFKYGPDKKTTNFVLALCHRDFALIGQFALPIEFSGIWLAQSSCPIFLKLDSLPICKGKPYLWSKLILNWTVRKN